MDDKEINLSQKINQMFKSTPLSQSTPVTVHYFRNNNVKYKMSYKTSNKRNKGECDLHVNYEIKNTNPVECIRNILKIRKYTKIHLHIKHKCSENNINNFISQILDNIFYYKAIRKNNGLFTLEKVNLF